MTAFSDETGRDFPFSDKETLAHWLNENFFVAEDAPEKWDDLPEWHRTRFRKCAQMLWHVIAALSASPVAQEPVGYISPETLVGLSDPHGAGHIVAVPAFTTTIPLYLARAPQPPVEGLREALEPFVRMYRGMFVSGHCGGASPEDWPDKWIVHITGGPDGLWTNQHGGVLTVADFRRLSEAATALASPSLSAAPVSGHFSKLQALWLALDGGPQPRCRDCADHDGTCPNDHDLPCDPQERALEQIRRLRAAPVAQEPVATKKVYIKPLRTIVEIQTAYADQIRDWLNTSTPAPPATPAGAAADEIARANALRECATIARDHTPGKHDGTLAAHVVGSTIERAILALLSRGSGDQSHSTHEA